MTRALDLHGEAPAPLEIYEKELIHVDNQRLVAQRLEVFKPILPKPELKRLQKLSRKLHKRLHRAKYNDLCSERFDIYQQLEDIKETYTALRSQLAELRAQPEPDDLMIQGVVNELETLKVNGLNLTAQGRKVQETLTPLLPIYQQFAECQRRLQAHEEALQEKAEQDREDRQFVKESKIVQSLLEDVFRRTPGCHHIRYDNRGYSRTDIPVLSRAGFNSDSHWFLLEASEKTTFGWRSLLPYGVTIDNLLSEKTLHNMSVAVNRQVEVRKSENGSQIYFLVHRLDSPDGLPRLVKFSQMIDFYPYAKHDLLPYPAGVMAGRKSEWKTFGELPHLLIAGSSQSGKSNQVNCIIATIVTTNSPDECRVILIDNKGGVEFTHWKDIPHLLMPMVKIVDNVLPALETAIKIMHRRLAILESVKAKDISAYNAKVQPEKRWARIVIFIDELATILDLGKTTKDIHAAMKLLTAMGRACGIHMVMCTQYPNIEVTPGGIKANLAVRMSGAMPSGSASMTILDSYDAKELPRIPGRMVISVGADMKEIQTAYISDQDIAIAVQKAQAFGEASPIPEMEDAETTPFIPTEAFGIEDVIELALSEFDGQLSANKMHQYLQEDSPGRNELLRMTRQIQNSSRLNYDGQEYYVKRVGNAYYLKQRTDIDDVPDIEPVSVQYANGTSSGMSKEMEESYA